MEIEIRAKIKNPEMIRDRLFELGAKKISEKIENDKYFSAIELCKKLGYSFILRIRKKGEEYILTAKTAKKKLDGVWEECETQIKEPNAYFEMFKMIGLEKVIYVEKKREEFKLNGLTINIDKFKKWGTFIEIELISEKIERNKLFDLMNELGIDKKDIMEKGYISSFLKEINSPFAKYIKN